jgi:peptidyl-prolyl cis-trans isomerase SurA
MIERFAAACLLATFMLVAGPATAQDGGAAVLDYIVAVVDDDVITAAELHFATLKTVAQLQESGTEPPPENVLVKRVLDRLILDKLEDAAAARAGIQVDDQTLNSTLNKIASRNQISLASLRESLETDGYGYARFRDDIRRELLTSRLRERMVNSRITVTDEEIETFLSQERPDENREYHLLHILISVPEGALPEQTARVKAKAEQVLSELRAGADFRRTAAAVSDGERALEGGDQGWRKPDEIPEAFAQVVISLDKGQISDLVRGPQGFHILKVDDIRSEQARVVQQVHARHILIRTNEVLSDDDARLRLARLRERILAGEDFDSLARANSDDSASAIKGGDLGWTSPGEFVPEFEEVLVELSVDEISQPFKTRFGWHILMVLERRDHDSTEEYARSQAREAIFRRKSDEEWELWLRRLRDEAYVEYRQQS